MSYQMCLVVFILTFYIKEASPQISLIECERLSEGLMDHLHLHYGKSKIQYLYALTHDGQ